MDLENPPEVLEGYNIAPPVMTNSLLLKIMIEIVSFPIKILIFNSYVKLPEGLNMDSRHNVIQ